MSGRMLISLTLPLALGAMLLRQDQLAWSVHEMVSFD
jgi:hypothetical protein